MALPAEAVRPLRLAVLRPGREAGAVVWPGDDEPATLHAGVRDERGAVVAAGSLVAERPPEHAGWGDGPAWRVRGMSTAPERRGQGLGAAVLAALLEHAAERGGGLVWCHAREAAVPLYERAGFTAVGEPYEHGPLGLHRLMVLELPLG